MGRHEARSDNFDVNTRVADLTQDSNLKSVVEVLRAQRDTILANWLEVATKQPFHRDQPAQAVADHVSPLLDALLDLLQRAAPRWVDPQAPLDDADVLTAAQVHARVRVEQGLQPGDVLVEFRLLRQEIWRALRAHLSDDARNGDILAAQLLINDALDGAITMGLVALTDHIEEVREEFLATTVHEVRHPVTVIKASVQLAARFLGRPRPPIERITQQHQHIEAAANHMEALLAVLVDTSQATLGSFDPHPRPVDLAGLLTDLIAQLPPASAKRVHVAPTPGVDASGTWDPDRLQQVFRNLLSNALKYSPPETPVEIRLHGDDTHLSVSVRDHGVGLAAEELPRLFQRYARARGVAESGIEGLGLGLYLCRRILEAHGGEIRAESPGVGQGTTIHVVLPR